MSLSESFLAQNKLWWILPLVLVGGMVFWLLSTDGGDPPPVVETDENFQYDAR